MLNPWKHSCHAGCGFEQSGQVEGVPAHSRRVGTGMIFKVPSKTNKPFCDSKIQTYSVIKLLILLLKYREVTF